MTDNLARAVRFIIIGIVLIAALGYATYLVGSALLQKSNDLAQGTSLPSYQTAAGDSCNIAVIPVDGQLWASEADAEAQTSTDNSDNVSAEDVLAQIEQADADSSIEGIVLRVDSPGGSPMGGEMIANALKRLNKPSVAVILSEGDSAAYLAATGANQIIASPFSDVADIGVTDSYLDEAQQDTNDGLTFEQIADGEFKDVGNPSLALTAADKAYLQGEVDSDYQTLINEIAANRSMATTTVQNLANGDSLTGTMAMGTGLIDALGDDSTAQAWFAKKLGKDSDPVLCE